MIGGGQTTTVTFSEMPFSPSNCVVLTAPVATPQQMTLTLGSQAGFAFAGFHAGDVVVMGETAFYEEATISQYPGAFSGGTQTVSGALSTRTMLWP